MKKILLSLSTIGALAAIVVGATGAFFTDTETSTGNTFTAGAIDLTIDNESYYNGVYQAGTSWQLSDLTDQLFFNFSDLKPGDEGEDTISVHVNSNDAYACMEIDITSTPENGVNEPESDQDATDGEDEGELQHELRFVFWADDGDNVLETDETDKTFWQNKTLDQISEDGTASLADSSVNIWTGQGGPIAPGEAVYIGKAWCFGTLVLSPEAQDDLGGGNSNGPDVRGGGVTCDGSVVSNASQTDGVVADVIFTAVQSRNNDNFVCRTPDVTVTETWSAVDLEGKDWFAKARSNDPTNFELAVGTNDAAPGGQTTGEGAWTSGQANNFTLDYDGAGTATLTVDGQSPVSHSVGVGTFGKIGITVKRDTSDSSSVTTVSNLVFSKGPLSTTSVAAGTSPSSLTISGVDLSDGFTLSGTFQFDYTSVPSNPEKQAVQFSVN